MKRTLQAQGAKPDQIKDFYENSYLQERGDTPERSRKNIKRRLEGKSQKKNLSFKEWMKADFRRDGDDTWDDLDSDELAEYRAEWKEETFGRKKK